MSAFTGMNAAKAEASEGASELTGRTTSTWRAGGQGEHGPDQRGRADDMWARRAARGCMHHVQ